MRSGDKIVDQASGGSPNAVLHRKHSVVWSLPFARHTRCRVPKSFAIYFDTAVTTSPLQAFHELRKGPDTPLLGESSTRTPPTTLPTRTEQNGLTRGTSAPRNHEATEVHLDTRPAEQTRTAHTQTQVRALAVQMRDDDRRTEISAKVQGPKPC